MTQVLGLLGSGLGPAGIVAALVAATVAAWVYVGKAGAIAVALLGLVLVAYETGSHQATVASDLASQIRDADAAKNALVEERRQVASIAAADARRAMAAEDAAEASAKRLSEIEAYLAANPAGACATADDARRLRAL